MIPLPKDNLFISVEFDDFKKIYILMDKAPSEQREISPWVNEPLNANKHRRCRKVEPLYIARNWWIRL